MSVEQECSFKNCSHILVFSNFSPATTLQQTHAVLGLCTPKQVKWVSIGLDFLEQFSQLHFHSRDLCVGNTGRCYLEASANDAWKLNEM